MYVLDAVPTNPEVEAVESLGSTSSRLTCAVLIARPHEVRHQLGDLQGVRTSRLGKEGQTPVVWKWRRSKLAC